MARADLDYITLSDFTPGVYSKYGAVGQLGKDGAAQPSDGGNRYTYGCYGDPDGGLRPLPRKVKTFTTDFQERGFIPEHYNGGAAGGFLTNFDPITDTKVGIIDFTVIGNERSAINTAASDDIWDGEGMEASYPDAVVDHPDGLYVLTAHYISGSTTVVNAWGTTTATSGWTPSASSAGFLVCQLKRWGVHRLVGASTDLTTVERILQLRVNANEIGDVNWGQLAVWGGGYSLITATPAVNPLNSVAAGSWPGGTIAVGRSIAMLGVAADPDGGTYTLEDLDRPGKVCVLAAAKLGPAVCNPDGRAVGLANIFSVFGAWSTYNYGYASSTYQGVNVSSPNLLWDNATVPQRKPPYIGGGFGVGLESGVNYNSWTYNQVPHYVVEHQDRFVGLIMDGSLGEQSNINDYYDQDGSTGTYIAESGLEPAERIRYSELNAALIWDQPTTATADYARRRNMNIWKRIDSTEPQASIWGNWEPSGVGCLISMNNDLLAVKHSGGAALVRGAMEDPSVIRLPTAHSTGGVFTLPCFTPLGAMYGTVEGVVVWNGGMETQTISAQLDGWFWDTGADNEVSHDNSNKRKNGLAGRFSYSYPFVYAPNDWVMDIRTQAWFRLIDPETDTNPYKHMFFDTNAQGKVYACRGAYDADNLDPVDLFDPRSRATKFQWVSQPIYRSINRDMDVQEVVVVAQGTGTVNITVLGIDGTEDTQTFQFDSDTRPQRQVANYKLRVSDLIVVVESEGMGTGVNQSDAPTVHAVNIGVPKEKQVGMPREGGN